MTMLDVARHLGVSWGMVKDIQRRNLERRFRNPDIRALDLIAIDEISIGKHHKYLTVVLDLRTGAVVHVGDGRGADALDPFWKRIKRHRVRLTAIAIDMSPSYIAAVLENHPDAEIVFDHFHVIKMYNDKLSDLRRDLYHEATGPLQKKVLKGTRWLLLKNSERLDSKRKEKKHLEEALKLNEPLALAYYMKEYLRLIWKQPNKEEAARCLDDWTARPSHQVSECLCVLQERFKCIVEGYLPIMITPYQQALWRAPTTKSKRFKNRLMASGIKNSSN